MSDIITTVRASIERVLADEATTDDVLTTLGVLARLKQITRELTDAADSAVIRFIDRNGDITDGQVRYYVAPNRTVKCKDPKAALGAILAASGGDVDALVGCLASGAFKHGACRELLPADEYEGLFEVTETKDLKTGKPVKRVQKFDRRFQ